MKGKFEDNSIMDLCARECGMASIDSFNKRYTNPIHMTSNKDGELIAHLGADLRSMNKKDAKVKGAFIMDGFVKEEERRQGVFKDLYKKFESENEDEGINLFFSFPVKNELVFLNDHADFLICGEIPVYAKILKASGIVKNSFLSHIANLLVNLKKKKGTMPDVSGLSVEYLRTYQDIDKLWARIKDDYPLMTERSSSFVKLRLENRANRNMIAVYDQDKLTGYLIYKFIDKGEVRYYMIMDFIFEDEKSMFALYQGLLQKSEENAITMIGLWKNDKLEKLIKNAGFTYGRSAIALLAKTKDLDIDVKNLSNWYLQPVEGEVY